MPIGLQCVPFLYRVLICVSKLNNIDLFALEIIILLSVVNKNLKNIFNYFFLLPYIQKHKSDFVTYYKYDY